MKFKDLHRLLHNAGYALVSSKKHMKYLNGSTIVMLPNKKEINRMLSMRILKQAGIDVCALELF